MRSTSNPYEDIFRAMRGIGPDRPLTPSEVDQLELDTPNLIASMLNARAHDMRQAYLHGGVRQSVEHQVGTWLAWQSYADLSTGALIYGTLGGIAIAALVKDVHWWHVVIWTAVSLACMAYCVQSRAKVAQANWDRVVEFDALLRAKGVKITHSGMW